MDRPSGSEGVSIDGGPFTSGSIHTYCQDNGHATQLCYFQATEYVEQAQSGCGMPDCSGVLYTYLKYKSTLNIGEQDYTLDPPLSIAVNGNGFHTQYFSVDAIAVNTTYITQNTRCQPSETYIWGFSYLMLFVFCFLTLIFAFVLSCVYLDTYHNSEADPFEQPASMYRDILDLAREIKRMLGEDGENISTEEVNRRIEKDTSGLELETASLVSSRREQKGLQHRRKEFAQVPQLRDKDTV